MERNTRRFTRRKFTILASAAMLNLVACTSQNRAETQPSQRIISATSTVVPLPEAHLSQKPHDYCRPPQVDSPVVSQHLAGTPVATQEVVPPPPRKTDSKPDDLDSLNITRSNIITGGKTPDLGKHQTLLIPIGYPKEEIAGKMPELASALVRAFDDIDAEFGYFDTSVPFGVNNVEQVAFISDIARIQKFAGKLRRVYIFDHLVFVTNADGNHAASHTFTDPTINHAIIAGKGANLKYRLLHEQGHAFGLNDLYTADYLREKIPSEGLFPNIESLSSRDRAIYEEINPPIVATGGICSKYGENVPIYTFYHRAEEGINLMKNSPTDAEIEKAENEGKSLFDQVQVQKMRLNVLETAARRNAA